MDIKQKNKTSAVIIEKEKKYGFWRFFLLSLYIMILGALGAILADRIIFPRLSQTELFKNSDFFKRAVEHTTIINKTEQVVVPGDFLGQKIFEENKSASIQLRITNYELRILNEEDKSALFYGFAVTQDGIVFCPNFLEESAGVEDTKVSLKNFQGEERDAELIEDKSDELISVFKYSGDRMNIPVLAFADSIKVGEEADIVSQNSVVTAFVKSVSEKQILLNDYPDVKMNGALVLNKEGKIAGMYRVEVKENGQAVSSVIPAGVLKNKIDEVLKN